MASEGPDPKTFSSWEDAFQYPIPTVRAMEKQLRRDIDSNKQKLRTLVGASYRDLLNTAETIIEMDGQMHEVEGLMGEVGRKCNTRLMERKERNLGTWSREIGAKDASKFAFTSQLAVLRSCPDVISRLLRRPDESSNLLLAARILVLSRLLHTKLSKRPHPPPPYLETLRNRLATLRRRLLEKIDKRFKDSQVPKEALLEAMCAFSLATSSSAADVLRHFQHLRFEAMNERMAASSEEGMLTALRLYVKTLRDIQGIVPTPLAQALQQLKAVPIFKARDVGAQMELNLDTHERWLGDDVKTFTPYVRHDDLSRVEAEKMLKGWARNAVSAFLRRLKERMQVVVDVGQVMKMRREVLELWLSQHQRSVGVDSAEILDGLREVFVDRAVLLIETKVKALSTIREIVSSIIKQWRPGVTDALPSLWSPSMTSMVTSNGAQKFRTKLIDLSSGKNEALSDICAAYETWLHTVSAIEQTIQDAKSIRWTDDINDVEDDDDILDNKQTLLSSDDPQTLSKTLHENLNTAYFHLETSLSTTASTLDNPNQGPQSIFLLRTWRTIRQSLPRSYRNTNLGLDAIRQLLSTVAKTTLSAPLSACSTRLAKLATANRKPKFAARALWEGNPELPVLPSPWAYRLLLEIVQAMAERGSDVWSAEAVAMVKGEVRGRIVGLLEESDEEGKAEVEVEVNGHADGEEGKDGGDAPEKEGADVAAAGNRGDGDDEDDDDEAKKPSSKDAAAELAGSTDTANGDDVGNTIEVSNRDRKIQRLFDVIYLSDATAVKENPSSISSSSDNNNGNDLIRAAQNAWVVQDTTLSEKDMARMRKNAAEYWKRTSLLFGLLA